MFVKQIDMAKALDWWRKGMEMVLTDGGDKWRSFSSI